MSKVLNKLKILEAEKESVVKDIKQIYENYGCDVEGMDERELSKVIRHYMGRRDELEKDLEESEKYSELFSDLLF